MGLGLNTESGGNFTPFVKFDARAGRWFRKDENGDVDITDNFSCVLDLEQIEAGWLLFAAGMAPNYLVQDINLGLPQKPEGKDWKQGFRVHVALPADLGGGIYELASSAKALIGVVDRLHTEYVQAPQKAEGKLPVVKMSGTTVIETESPKGKTRNYAPNLSIIAWVARPATLVKKAPTAAATPAAQAAPPATGSTQVAPPTAKPAPAPSDMAFG